LTLTPVHVGSVVGKEAQEQVSLRVLQFCPVRIIPPRLHNHSFITDTQSFQQVTGYFNNTQYTSALHGAHFIPWESAIGTQRIQYCQKVKELNGLMNESRGLPMNEWNRFRAGFVLTAYSAVQMNTGVRMGYRLQKTEWFPRQRGSLCLVRCGGRLAREGLEGEECWAASGKRERKTNYYTQNQACRVACS